MRQLVQFVIILFALLENNVYAAVLNDSTVVVLADWNRGEKHLFRYSLNNYRISRIDTLYKRCISRDFTITIDDSTQHLYSLRYDRCNNPLKRDSIPLDIFPLKLMVNRNGALIKILNWDGYIVWGNNDIKKTSYELYPFVSLLSFNGKKLKLNQPYRDIEYISGEKIGVNDSIISKTEMVATRDFEKVGEYGLITINTVTTYQKNRDISSVLAIEKFSQIIDSDNGWAIATYFEKYIKKDDVDSIMSWNIKLID